MEIEVNKIEVKDCFNCPFSNWSTGGHKGSRPRLQHKCKVQKLGFQWKADNSEGYDCFETCPLKTSVYNVVYNGNYSIP